MRLRRATHTATPGDPHNDLDLNGPVVTEIVYDGDHDIIIALEGGNGWWDTCSHHRSDIANATNIEYTLHLASIRQQAVEALVAQLEDWRTNHTPLRLAMHPQHHSTLIDPATGTAVSLPRN